MEDAFGTAPIEPLPVSAPTPIVVPSKTTAPFSLHKIREGPTPSILSKKSDEHENVKPPVNAKGKQKGDVSQSVSKASAATSASSAKTTKLAITASVYDLQADDDSDASETVMSARNRRKPGKTTIKAASSTLSTVGRKRGISTSDNEDKEDIYTDVDDNASATSTTSLDNWSKSVSKGARKTGSSKKKRSGKQVSQRLLSPERSAALDDEAELERMNAQYKKIDSYSLIIERSPPARPSFRTYI